MSLKGFVRRTVKKVKRIYNGDDRIGKSLEKSYDWERQKKKLNREGLTDKQKENISKAVGKSNKKKYEMKFKDYETKVKSKGVAYGAATGSVIVGAGYASKKYKEKKAKEAAAKKQAAYDKTFKGKVEKSYKKVKSKFKGKDNGKEKGR